MNCLANSPWPLFFIVFTVNSGANINTAFNWWWLVVVAIVYNLCLNYKQKEKPKQHFNHYCVGLKPDPKIPLKDSWFLEKPIPEYFILAGPCAKCWH